MDPLFVFTADLHLADGAWSTRPGLFGDAYFSLAQIVDYCIEQRLPLILAGDVLDKKSNNAQPVARLCAEMARMADASIPVYYTQGNHEYDRAAPWLSVHSAPIHMHGRVSDINGCRVAGLDWLPRGEIQKALAAVDPAAEILVTHQFWQDFMGNAGKAECALSDVHHVRTVLSGDFHGTKVVQGVNAQGLDVQMLSPGSTCMQSISEPPEKHVFLVSRNPANVFGYSFTPVPLRTRKFTAYTVQTAEQLDELCAGKIYDDVQALTAAAAREGLPAELQMPLVRIKFNKDLPDAYLRLTTAICESAHVFCDALNQVDDSAANGKPVPAAVRPLNTLTTALADLLEDDTDGYQLAEALVASDAPSKELDAWFRKFMRLNDDAVTAAES